MSDLRALVLSVDNKKHTMLAKADYLVVGQGIKLGAASGSLELGDGSTDVWVPGTLQVTGLMTLHGGSEFEDDITVLGNLQVGTSPYDGADWVKFNSRVDLNGDTPAVSIPFLKEKDHIISVDATTTTNKVGGNLTSQAGTGSIASASVAGKQGGHITSQGGTGGAALASNNNGGAGGHGYLKGGTGGAGALAVTAGGGGNSYVTAGDAGAPGAGTGATGGSVYVDAGSGDVANGSVNIGTGSVTPTAITIGKSGVTTTNQGNLTVSETFTANGNTVLGNAATDSVSFVAQVGPAANKHLVFVPSLDHEIKMPNVTTPGASGGSLSILGGKGANADATHNAYSGPWMQIHAGDGGNGDGTHAAADGMAFTVSGGHAGTPGTTGATGGYVSINGGTGSGNLPGGYATLKGGDAHFTGNGAGALCTVSGGNGNGTGLGGGLVLTGGTGPGGVQANIAINTQNMYWQSRDDGTRRTCTFAVLPATVGTAIGNNLAIGAGAPATGSGNNGGDLYLEAGAKDGAGMPGYVYVGTTYSRQVLVGSTTGTFKSQALMNSFVNDIGFVGNLGTTYITFPAKGTGVGDVLEIKSQQGANGSASGDLHLYGATSDTQTGSVLIAGGTGTSACSGGNVSIDAGIATGSGVNGDVSIGTGTAVNVEVGNNTATTVMNGVSIAFKEAGAVVATVTGGNLIFSNTAASRNIATEPSPPNADGKVLAVASGAGGDAGSTAAAGAGAVAWYSAGFGGSSGPGAGETAGIGGLVRVRGGTGGQGNATGPKAAAAGGGIEVKGGAAGPVNGGTGAKGGDVTISGGVNTGDGDTGAITITTPAPTGGGDPGIIYVQTSATDRLTFDGSLILVQAGTTLATASTGNINLPNNTIGGGTRFNIEGAPVTANVTAANLNELTGGGATSLHSHAGGVVLSGYTKIVGHNVIIGNPVYLYNDTGVTKAMKADATTNPVVAGIIYEAKSTGDATQIILAGETPAMTDAAWVGGTFPVQATDLGKDVYLSTTAGRLTLTPPTANGDTVIRVGIVSAGGTGASKIIVMIGESTTIVA